MPSRSSPEFRASENGHCSNTVAESSGISSVKELFATDRALAAYKPLGMLGKGGMGIVVKALESSTDRLVALKIVPCAATPADIIARGKESRQRFEVEVRATARLQHPNIVPIFAVGHGNGFSFYTMRMIEGISITRFLTELANSNDQSPSSKLSLDQLTETIQSICKSPTISTSANDDDHSAANGSDAAQLGSTDHAEAQQEEVPTRVDKQSDTPGGFGLDDTSQEYESERVDYRPFGMSVYRSFAEKIAEIADALQYASDEGVVHRDVKPGNILIDGNGKLYLADFGLAKIQEPNPDLSTACVGTPGYIAPERLRGQATTDPRSDIFALGLVLEQLVTLSVTSPLHTEVFESSRRSDALASVPRPLRRIIKTATAEDVGDRYDCAGEFAEDLRRFARGERVLARANNIPPALFGFWRRPILLRAVAAILIAALAVSLWHVGSDLVRLRGENEQAEYDRERTVALYLNMLDDLYLKASDDFFRSSIDNHRRSVAPQNSPPISSEKREQLLIAFDYLDELATTQSDDTSTILRIAQTMGRLGFVLQTGGCDDDAGRSYDRADKLLVELNDAGPRAAIERCWLAYHQASWQHRQIGYERAADGYHQIIELAMPFLVEKSTEEDSRTRLHEVVGMTRLAQDEFQDALEHLEAAKAGELSSESRSLALATAYRMVGRYADALPIAAAYAADNPSSASGWRNLAAIQMHLGDVSQAAENYEKCLSIEPSNDLAMQGLAWARHRLGDTSRAIELVNQALEVSAANEVILTARGVFFAAQNRFEESVDDLERAYELRPGSGYVADKLFPALLFFPNADVELADQLLRESGHKLPPSSYQFARALVDYSMGRYDRAAVGFRTLPQSPIGPPVDSRALTLARLCDVRSDGNSLDQRAEALQELEHQRRDHWPFFGPSPFDQAIVQHIESFLGAQQSPTE